VLRSQTFRGHPTYITSVPGARGSSPQPTELIPPFLHTYLTMSAYGTIPRPAGVFPKLSPLTYAVTSKGSQAPMHFVTILPVKRPSVPDALFKHLQRLFNGVVTEGRTYPHEFEMTGQQFEDYYFCEAALLPQDERQTELTERMIASSVSWTRDSFPQEAPRLGIQRLMPGSAMTCRRWTTCWGTT